MKKFYFISIIIILFLFSPLLWGSGGEAFSQNIKGGVILGFNTTQVRGDNLAGYHKFGLNVGAIAIVPIKKKISVSMEILYSERGSRSSGPESDAKQYVYLLKLNYVEVPFLFNYQDKEKINFGVGMSISTLVKFKEYRDGEESPDTIKPYTKREYSFVANGNYLITKKWVLNLRYSHSIFHIGVRIVDGELHKQYHDVVTIRVIYLF